MSDFLGDLAAIKADMVKSAPQNSQNSRIPAKNPNKDEIKEHFLNESKEEKFERLKDEFSDFVEYNKVKKI